MHIYRIGIDNIRLFGRVIGSIDRRVDIDYIRLFGRVIDSIDRRVERKVFSSQIHIPDKVFDGDLCDQQDIAWFLYYAYISRWEVAHVHDDHEIVDKSGGGQP